MYIPQYFRMMYSSNAGWDVVKRDHSTIKTLFYIVLPFLCLPPIMILYAGFEYGAKFFSTSSEAVWITSAVAFLIAELLTLHLMAWAIKSIAATSGICAEYRNTLAIAASSAVPMWLSSLALFVPQPLFIIAIVLLGLIASISLSYHGTKALLRMHEALEVAVITHTTISLGVVVWVFLLTLVVIPVLW